MEPELHGLDGLDALRVLLTEIKNSYEKHPRSLGVLYALIFEAVGPVPELRERFVALNSNLRSRITHFIERGQRDGSIVSGIDPEHQAAVIVAQLRGVGYLWKLDPGSVDSGAVLGLFIRQLLGQLAARRSAAPDREPAASS